MYITSSSMYGHHIEQDKSRAVRVNPGKEGCQFCSWSAEQGGKMNISQSPFAPENLVSREGYGSLVPRQPAHLHTQAESGAYYVTGFLLISAAAAISLFNRHTYAIGSVSSLSGHAIACSFAFASPWTK